MRALILPALALCLAAVACDDNDDRQPRNNTPPADSPRDNPDRHED